MKVFVTGGTGFVGSNLLPALLQAGHQVEALVRPGSEAKIAPAVAGNPNFSVYLGDILQKESLAGAGTGSDAIIHMVGIIQEDTSEDATYERVHYEGTQNAVALAKRVGVQRFIHVSALGARDLSTSNYYRTKYMGESAVKGSGLNYVIFRPSLIVGKGSGFINTQERMIYPYAFIPIPGNGQRLVQPVSVDNVVEGLVKSLSDESAASRIYEFGGPEQLTLDQIVDIIAEAKLAIPIVKLHWPMGMTRILAGIMHAIFPGFPVSKEQIVLLQEDNVVESDKFFRDFGILPKRMDVAAMKSYV